MAYDLITNIASIYFKDRIAEIEEYKLNRKIVDVYRKYQKKSEEEWITTTLWVHEKTQTNHVAKHIPTDIINLTISRIQNLKNFKQEYLSISIR